MDTYNTIVNMSAEDFKSLIVDKHIPYCKQNNRFSNNPRWWDIGLNVISIRENEEDGFNEGKWNDWGILVLGTATGYNISIYAVTVDPALPGMTDGKGRGHLRQGSWNSYKIRKHNYADRYFANIGKTIGRWALCQDIGEVGVLRTDGNRKIIKEEVGNFNINYHDRGGYRDPSLACTVVASDDSYINLFLPLVYDIKNDLYIPPNWNDLTYNLINHKQFESYINEGLQKTEKDPTIFISTTEAKKATKVSDTEDINSLGLDLIKSFEALRLNSYKDQKGIWTIGYGTINIDGKPVTAGMTITEEQATKYLMDYLNKTEKLINDTVKVDLNENQFSALVSFVYNVGDNGYKNSTLLKKINASDFVGAAEQFLVWNKVTINGVKQISNGLTRRRKAEKELFEKSVA